MMPPNSLTGKRGEKRVWGGRVITNMLEEHSSSDDADSLASHEPLEDYQESSQQRSLHRLKRMNTDS